MSPRLRIETGSPKKSVAAATVFLQPQNSSRGKVASISSGLTRTAALQYTQRENFVVNKPLSVVSKQVTDDMLLKCAMIFCRKTKAGSTYSTVTLHGIKSSYFSRFPHCFTRQIRSSHIRQVVFPATEAITTFVSYLRGYNYDNLYI